MNECELLYLINNEMEGHVKTSCSFEFFSQLLQFIFKLKTTKFSMVAITYFFVVFILSPVFASEYFLMFSLHDHNLIAIFVTSDQSRDDLPNRFKIDDFDKCYSNYRDEALFCMTHSYLTPNSTKCLLEKDRRIHRSLCLNDCQKTVQKLGNRSDIYLVKQVQKDKVEIFQDHMKYRNIDQHRSEYGDIINQCINFDFMDNYNLSADVGIEFCVKHSDKSPLGNNSHMYANIFVMKNFFHLKIVLTSPLLSSFLEFY